MAQSSEAASNSKAIIDELNDQVRSYHGLLEESEKRIKRVKYKHTYTVRTVAVILICDIQHT